MSSGSGSEAVRAKGGQIAAAAPARPLPGDALATIRAEVRRRGLDRTATLRVLGELFVHVSILATGLVGFFATDAWTWRTIFLGVAMLGHVGVTTNSHTWAHRAASSKRWINDAVAFFSGNFVSGISFLFWRDKHNRRHHGSPNVKGVDPDHDFWPFIALTDAEVARSGATARIYYRWQWLAFPLLLALMLPRMKAEGWGFALGRAWRGGRERAVALLDLGVLCASLGLWWGVPLLVGTLLDAVVLNLVREASLSYAFFAIFAPAHVPRDAVFLDGPVRGDFVLRQTATTLDYRVGPRAGFFLSGLQYQVEHHLMPGLPHVHYAKIRPIVASVCEDLGYPHRTIGWGDGIRRSLAVLRAPKPVTSPADSCERHEAESGARARGAGGARPGMLR